MKLLPTLGVAAGSLALVLSACSSTSDEQDASQSSAADATQDAAVGDNPFKINLVCEEKTKSIELTDDMSAVSVKAIGAAGWQDDAGGGMGGVVTATIPINKGLMGSTIYAKVGCQGSGGWPNGGEGGDGSSSHGGGGSTSLETSASDFTPIIVAGAGGGSDHVGDNAGGSVLGTGKGGNGEGNCDTPGGTQTSTIAKACSTSATKGRDGGMGKGGDAGGNAECDGGGGGGGYQGGAGGTGCSMMHDETHGSGGAGSSFVPPKFKGENITYSLPTGSPMSGSLGLTFMCGDDECATQPTPK